MLMDGIPFIFIILICLVLIFIAFIRRKYRTLPSRRRIYWNFGIYLFLALLSLFGTMIHSRMNAEILEESRVEEGPHLIDAVYQGTLDTIAEKYLVLKEEHPLLDGVEELIIQPYGSGGYSSLMALFLEEKEEGDNLLEISYYQTPTYWDGINVTSWIPSTTVELHANTLLIHANHPERLIAKFKTEFPYHPFEKSRIPIFEEERVRGEELLHVKVPPGTEITLTNEEEIYMITEEDLLDNE